MENKVGKLKIVPLKDIKLNPKNRNIHPPAQISQFVTILKANGFRSPGVISNRSGLLVIGHGRYLALEALKEKEMPCLYQDFDSEEQEFQCAVADNALAAQATLDLTNIHVDLQEMGPFDLDLLGVKDFQFEPTPGKTDEDEIPQAPKIPKTSLGDLFQLGEHRLLCGDSTNAVQVARLMNGEKADMLCWDPPWNVGFEYNQYNDSKDDQKYGQFLTACLNSFSAVSNDSYVAVVWQSEKNWRSFHLWFPESARMVAVAKNFVSLAKHFLQRAWDPALMWTSGEYKYWHTPNHNQRDYFLSNTAATHDDGSGIRESGHPCPRQVDAYEYFITGWTKPARTVLDLSAGSGTCFVACEKTNRKCYGMEIDPIYCDVIIERWEKYTGKKAVKI